ncbi:MAG: L-ribulose-5-phosphate 4-epimerase [Elusimicrobia bacterium]|nr:L-ribulose-5-phosphate 4-epimerase [Elusimicrobiota bacterium]
MLLKKLREEVYRMNLELPKNHLVTMTSGNVSGRDIKTGYIVIKPSGINYDELSPAKMVIVDLSGKVIEGKLSPSVDTISHLVIYRNRKDLCGVVHTHSSYATSFALLGKPIPVYLTAHADEFGEVVPITRYASPFPLEEVGEAVVETLGNSRVQAVLVKSHGVFAFGTTATSALKAAVMVEDIAKTCHLTLLLGKPNVLPGSEIKKWYRRYHEVYGQKNSKLF